MPSRHVSPLWFQSILCGAVAAGVYFAGAGELLGARWGAGVAAFAGSFAGLSLEGRAWRAVLRWKKRRA